MTTENIKATAGQAIFISTSKKLKERLESKVEAVFIQGQFDQYGAVIDYERAMACGEDVFLSGADNHAAAGKLVCALKTWLNMQYADRLSVIDKFRTGYQNVISPESINEKPVLTIAFCRFLISELPGILAEGRWQVLTHRAD